MVSTASPSGLYNLVSRVYVGDRYAPGVEQTIDGVIVRKLGNLGYAYQKGASRWTPGANSVRDGQLEIPYQLSASPNLNTQSIEESLTDEIRAALATMTPVSYAYFSPAITRALPPGSNRDLTIYPASQAAPTTIGSARTGGVNPSQTEGKLNAYHGEKPPTRVLDESTYESPAQQGSTNTPLIIAALGIGGLLLWTLAESRKKGR